MANDKFSATAGDRAKEMAKIRDEGYFEGVKKGHNDLLDMIEQKYMAPDVARGSERGQAILDVARECTRDIRLLEEKTKKKRFR